VPESRWQSLETILAAAPRADFRIRLRQELERSIAMTTIGAPVAASTLTPFVTTVDVDRLIAFAKQTFDAQEVRRKLTTDGALHCLVGLGDSLLMVASVPPGDSETRASLHVYVPDVDATYRRALDAGAASMHAPQDKPYGARDATVKDYAGNLWFIATRRPGVEPPVRMRTVTPWLIARDALGLIDFLKQGFGAIEVGIHISPDGRLLHAALSIGDSVLEFGEADGVPPAAFYVLAADPGAVCEQALRAGARSVSHREIWVEDQRSGTVEDAWGNIWHVASDMPFNPR
jgi:uncharacterized glyoxalase superfamily protein PhnB